MANLYFEAHVDISIMKRELREMEQRMRMSTLSIVSDGQQIDQTMKRIGQAAAGYLSLTAGKGFLDQIIRVRGEFQQLDIALETMLGNKEKSDKLMGEVVQLAAKTPFSLTELGKGAKQLIAFKEPADKVVDTLRRIGDVSAGVSVPVGELVAAYGKVSAKGKMQAEELNQFAERGVPIISELAKVIGTTDDKIYKMAEQGKIGFNELQQAIMNMTSEGGQFFNLMEKQAGSLTGLVSNLGDAWDRMLNDIGQSNEGVIADSIKGLTSLVDNYEDVIKIIGSVALAYGTYKAAIVAVSMAQKAQLLATQIQEYVKMSKALGVATANQIAFNRATLVNPYVAVAAAVATLVGGLVWYSTRTREAISVSADFKKTLNDEVKSIEGNFKALKNTAEGTDARRIAIENINSKYGEYLGYLLNEKSSLEDIEKAQEDATKALGKNLALKAQEKDLAQYKSKVAEAEEAYSNALKTIFDKRNISSEAKGAASAFLDQFIEDLSNSNIKQGYRFVEDFYEKALKDNGILAETFDKIDLETSIEGVITARQNENRVVEDLTNTYDAYLKKLGIIKDIKPVAGTASGTPEAVLFDVKEFEKSLKAQKAMYEEYESVVKAMGQEYADERYAALLKEGEDYALFLRNKLKEYEKNAAAIAAIAVAAESGKVDLQGNPTEPIKAKGVVKVSKAFPAPDAKALKSMGDYEKKGLAIAKMLKQLIANDNVGDMGQGFIDAGYAMQDLARFAGEFDAELAETISKVADLSGSIGNAMTAFASGDIFQQVGSIAQVGTAIASLFDRSADAQQRAAYEAEKMALALELQNKALERQLRLMKEASGDERVQAEADTLALITKQMAALDNKAKNFTLKTYWAGLPSNFDDFANVKDLEKQLYEGLEGDTMSRFGPTPTAEDLLNSGSYLKNLEEAQDLTALSRLPLTLLLVDFSFLMIFSAIRSITE
jgi:tape measure domain-containing protein